MNTDPLSILSVRAEMKIATRREDLISFGAASGMASVGGLVAVACAVSLLTSSNAVVAHIFLSTTGASAALFFGRAAIRSYRELLFKTMTDINRIATLTLENQQFRGRIWEHFDKPAGAAKAAGESSGGSREGATSPAANVYTINPRKPTRFQ